MGNGRYLLGLCLLFVLVGCSPSVAPLPTVAVLAAVPSLTPSLPATFTTEPEAILPTSTPFTPRPTSTASQTPLPIPTNTPYTPLPTRTPTGTPTAVGTATPVVKPINQYGYNEIIPFQAFPTPRGDNRWCMHWMPTNSQEHGVIDRFVGELVNMHIKWVVFLNDGTNIGDNDYLVERLTANGIMPIMRLYQSTLVAYNGDIGALVTHYRAKGVYYYQLYNEPNVDMENTQGFANPNLYATAWAAAARQVINSGGLPGLGALSPGGSYDHFDFLDRTLRAIEYNGDSKVLNHAWLSIHNYQGLRPFDDPGGFLLFRRYNDIVSSHLGRSLPIIGTEGGSYSPDHEIEKQYITYQYTYMRSAEPYFLAYCNWLLANSEGGGGDPSWEWQSLFRPGFVHPVVTDFFYKNQR